MTTAGNRASTGVNVSGGGASLGSFTTQAVPVVLASAAITPVVRAVATSPSAVTNLTTISPSALSVASRVTTPSVFAAANIAASALPLNQLPISSLRPVTAFPALSIIASFAPIIRRPPTEILSVSHLRINNATFVPINANGITSLRPEIISLVDFKSVVADSEGHPTKAGRLMDLQFQAKSLREKTLLDIVNNIRGNPDTATDLDLIQSDFARNFRSTDNLVVFYKQTIDTIELLKQYFDIKNIPNSMFNNGTFQTLRSFYNHRMEFPINSFDRFSNTKLLYQMMFDFRAIMENYSLNLLNLNDPDRSGDTNPITIDKSYTTTNGFSFTMDTIRSFGQASQNASEDAFFVRFLHTLPSVVDDRIKLLVTLLSKELRVSAGLGLPDVQRTLTQTLGAATTDGNPFDNLIGTVGNTALDPPLGPNSISSLFFLDASNNSSILPFENKYIDANSANKVYIPGTNYFIDSLLDVTNNQFNTAPILNYVQLFTNRLQTISTVVEKLYDFKETQSTLAATEVLKKFLLSMRHGMEGLGATTQLSITQAAMVALFRLTAVDNQLKQMLFQFLLMKALQTQNANRSDLRFITLHIINEINDLEGLSFVHLDPETDTSIQNGRNLSPFLTQLATDIQNRIFTLVGAVIGDGRVPVRPVTDPRTGRVTGGSSNNSQQQQSDNIRGSDTGTDNSISDHSPSDNTSRPVGSHRTRLTFDVDSTSSITSALLGDNALIRGFIDAVISMDIAASPGHNTATYVDSNGRTRFNQISATTLMLMMYEIYCDLITKYTSSDFTRSEQANTCDMLIDPQFNDVNMNIIDDVISHTETVLSPTRIGLVGAVATPNVGVATTTGLQVQAVGGVTGTGGSGGPPATVAVNGPGGALMTDLSALAGNINTLQIAQRTGTTPGQAQGGANQNQAFVGGVGATPSSRTSAAAIIGLAGIAQSPLYMLEMRSHENSLYSIKQKVYEEDLAVANILHILSVVYRRLSSVQETVVNYFTQATITNFLNQSNTSPQDLVSVLNPAQVRIIAHSKDTANNLLHASGDELGQQVGFIAATPNDINIKNGILSLLSQPDYQERNAADEKIKILTIGVPAGFSKNLSDRINTNNINPASFTIMKDYDVVEIQVHKRDLEHEELVFKPKSFLFDLSLFGNGLPNTNVNTDFNVVIQSARLLDYQRLSNPEQTSLTDLNTGPKYDFLSQAQKLTMFKNHVVSDLLNSYINYMTAMKITEEVFVDIHSDTYNRFNQDAPPVLNQGRRGSSPVGQLVNPLLTLTTDFQTKVVRFLNIVKHKNLPARPILDLLNDPTVDDESKDILRTIAFGNIVFNPRMFLQRLLSPKLFDRVYTVPINVDSFPIDVDRTNSTSVGRAVLQQLSQQQGTIVTNSTGDLYLAPRDKHSPIFEDYFVTIDLTTVI